MSRRLSRFIPLGSALVLLWGIGIAVLLFTMKRNGGNLVYAADDAYIHMAMAKNMATHGTWGVTRYGFSSSSSSPLWTLLLAGVYKLFGVNDAAPLILNVIFATLILVIADFVLRRQAPPFNRLQQTAVMWAVIILTPLPLGLYLGMEHTLHTLLTMLFIFLAAAILSGSDAEPAPRGLPLLILSPLLAATRYEGLFLIFAACALFALRGRWRFALALGGLALVPVLAYGLISRGHGWFWLPNSVTLKSGFVSYLSRPGLFLKDIVSTATRIHQRPELSFPLGLSLTAYLARSHYGRSPWDRNQSAILLFAVAVGAHLLAIQPVFGGRYDLYLVAPGIIVVAMALRDLLPTGNPVTGPGRMAKPIAVALLGLALLVAYGQRVGLLRQLPRATTNVYEQQWQMGRFLREYYSGKAIAINDVGAINYTADIRCLDLFGLSSLDVAEEVMKGGLRRTFPSWFHRLADSHGVMTAVVYRSCFDLSSVEDVDPAWIDVGEWTIENNVACGDATVSFFARDRQEADRLTMHLREFAPRLPPGVQQSGEYTQQAARQ